MSATGAAPRQYRVVDLIRRKRDGGKLTPDEISYLVSGYTAGTIPDYQISALLMAIVLRRMTDEELAALTEAMLYSGQVLNFPEIEGRKVDKHSTGGVGDKTSLVIAPIVAACGVRVPMISGRGLGHTGGTLDKLESIPGFNVNLPLAEFRRVLAAVGCGLIGQTAEIAPADKKLYALRDVTGTVESPYLICASIMSKKLAEGIDALVLDVKTGSGAFMKEPNEAKYLAQLMVETGKRMGKKVVALITDMDQPLGRKVGNALEVEECIEVLQGAGPADLRELCIELAAWMLFLGDHAGDIEQGRRFANDVIFTGDALRKFAEIIAAQGGDASVLENPARLPKAANQVDISSPADGFVTSIMCEQIGTACVVLGGGREKKEDAVDPAVGLVLNKKVGDPVTIGESLVTVHYNSEARLNEARELIETAYKFDSAAAEEKKPLVLEVIE
ncbi:MAG TPA: thymidine phosphorylase [Terriglobales bacterium]|nr:thymidine phosphorylase [Terriglobales bacterium]